MWVSIVIFCLVYVVIATGKLHKAVAALAGSCLLIALGGISPQTAYGHIDLNVILLLMGMMVLVHVVAETGFFQWVAIRLSRAARGNPLAILVSLIGVTALVSAFLDNVTTILLMAPVTFVIAHQLELDPVPFLVLEALASNIGGTATLVGDPPNILIGSSVGLSFNEFVINLGPIVLICTAFLMLAIWLIYKRRFHVPEHLRARLRDADPAKAITNRRNAIKVCIVMALVLIGFFFHDRLNVPPSVVAIAGAMAAIIVTRQDTERAFGAVQWPVLMFFVGLFILVGGLDEQGVLLTVAKAIVGATQGHFLLTVLLVLWASAFISGIVDNIPFVAAMIPVVQSIIPQVGAQMGLEDPEMVSQVVGRPLWWALALGACFGGNMTLIGASANVVASGIADQNGHHISFWRFMRYGVPTTIAALVLCSGYLYLRYFVLGGLH